PRWALLAIGLPAVAEDWLAEFSAGLFALAERFGVELIGGDTTRSPVRTISIVAIGEVPAGVALYRSGARPGDDLWVSGELGGAALALRRPEIAEAARRLHEPEPRVELGLALTRIGTIEAGAPRLVVRDERGAPMSYRGGYDHFAGSA